MCIDFFFLRGGYLLGQQFVRAGADKNEYLLPGSCFVYCPYSLEEFFKFFLCPV